MEHIFEYSELEYTSESRRKLARSNIEFWQKLQAIEMKYGILLRISHSLKHDFNGYLDALKFECSNPDMLNEAEAAYRQYYQCYPLIPEQWASNGQ